MNIVILTGRLTKDPELKTTGTKPIAKFTLAVDRMKKGEADFVPCIAFDKSAEFVVKYFAKGRKMNLVGRLYNDSYEKDGRKVYTSDVIADRVEFGDSKPEEPEKATKDDGFDLDDPLPF